VYAVAVVIPLQGPVNAQTGLGAGLSSLPCTEIIEKTDDKSLSEWTNFWVKGFWTGLNLAMDVNGKPTKDLSGPVNNVAALKARILAYCYENPDAVLLDIALNFYSELPAHPTND
jgi:hypothetical protein